MSASPDFSWAGIDDALEAARTKEELLDKPKLKLTDWDTSARFIGDPPPRKWLAEGAILSGKAALVAAAGGVCVFRDNVAT